MDEAIKHHLQKDIKERTRLTGGYTFETWLLTLSDNEKVIFRTQRDFKTTGGREIIIADVLEREKFFYDTVNKEIGHTCPQVYVVDGTKTHFDMPFCLMEYIEGTPPPLNDEIGYKIGETVAKINGIKIDPTHPYIADRGSWEDFFANRLYERLIANITSGVITQDEINKIISRLRQKKAKETLSFLHLDMRRVNMIYSNGKIFILDAENCEFGDPLFELATIDNADELYPAVLEGYKNACHADINLDDDLYLFYKMERAALVLYVFTEEVKNDPESRQLYLKKFNELKERLL